MKRLSHVATAALVTMASTGCMSIYAMPPGSPAATLEVQKGAVAWICADTPPQRLQRGKDGLAQIPADRRVTLGINFAASDGYMNYSCAPSSSIVPKPGASYLQDFQVEGEKCTALVYLKTDDKRVGLAFDPSMQPGGPACTR